MSSFGSKELEKVATVWGWGALKKKSGWMDEGKREMVKVLEKGAGIIEGWGAIPRNGRKRSQSLAISGDTFDDDLSVFVHNVIIALIHLEREEEEKKKR